ncbi:reductive dehalogenase [Dehalogenimonas alkenigignens]|uniref:Reductive dehalogenase n=1 Tax=Dehalogenimonas alkenigignens TaxID=1217799 RepID=A0A0W0GH52_9CHLR|nr:reductive dehalogenase [Dehalogenimonas alkenigignens]KTB47891.1 reductive dehalogenase [Dehalogenimonas alkenigignens]
MSKYHATLSRRDFMKAVGLAGAGVGAAAAMAPGFKDLDDLAATSTNQSHPWWVKDREFNDPTNEIDWNTFKPYDNKINAMPTINQAAKDANTIRDNNIQKAAFASKAPGDSLRDYAFGQGSSFIGPDAPWDGPSASLPANAEGKRWEDTPENNLQMMRAALHTYGAVLTGALEVNDKTKKIFDASGFVFDSSDKGYQDEKKVYHIPEKCKYMLTFAVKQNYIQSLYQLRLDDSMPGGYGTKLALGNQAIGHAYSNSSQTGYAAMRMVKTLGYQALKTGVRANVPLGIFSGLGEQGRATSLLTPRYGLMVRYTNYFFTDLPLAPTPPMDAGLITFCKTCVRCGERCPSESISQDNDTTWDTASTGNRPGFKGFFMNWQSCIDFGSPGACGNCQATCPFNHASDGVIHPIVRAAAATTPVFNSFFATMDRAFDYAKAKSDKELTDWWSRDLDKWQADTTLGSGKNIW